MTSIRTKFAALSASAKALLWLQQIFSFSSIIASSFINIFIYKLQSDITNVLWYNMLYFLGIYGGFCLVQAIAPKLPNLKHMYYVCYGFLIGTFIFLLIGGAHVWVTTLFGLLYGIGSGIFRCLNNTYTAGDIKPSERDYYFSVLQAINVTQKVLVPFLVSGIFWLTMHLGTDGYLRSFLLTICVYVVSFFAIRNLDAYHVDGTSIWTQFAKLSAITSRQRGYYLTTGTVYSINGMALTMVSYHILSGEVQVGVWQGLASVLAIFAVLAASTRLTAQRRVSLFVWLTSVAAVACFLLAGRLSFSTFLIYTIVLSLCGPLLTVLLSTYSYQQIDDITIRTGDRGTAVFLVDFPMLVGRIIFLLLLLGVLMLLPQQLSIRSWVFWAFGCMMLSVLWFVGEKTK